jgi:hypothetical protein
MVMMMDVIVMMIRENESMPAHLVLGLLPWMMG